MQCPECSYISFKIEKACGACGFKFKKTERRPTLAGKESFSIFTGPAVKEQEHKEDSASMESVGVLEEQGSFVDPETGEFNLDLPEIGEETVEEAQISSDPEITEYEPLDFDPDADIDLGEVEVEGLGLEPFSIAEETKTKETSIPEIEPDSNPPVSEDSSSEELVIADEVEESMATGADNNEEIVIQEPETNLEPELEITEPEAEPTLSIDEPALEITEPEAEPILSIDEPALEITEPEAEPTLSIDEPALEINEPEPELDLGDSEIKLDLGYEPPPINEPDPATLAAQLDELDLNLEIDDSDGPLTIQNNEIPDIEIEDLGLELESPDDPDKDKP